VSGGKVPATGNGLKPGHPGTFLTVSGGPSGNTDTYEPEVHIKIEGCCGDFAQGWFKASDLEAAIAAAKEGS
jgi:hypothetical protein